MFNNPLENIAIIGGGAWATSLAIQLLKNHESCTLYLRNRDVVNEINTLHTNSKYIPGTSLPGSLRASNDFNQLNQHQALIVAVPSVAFNDILRIIKNCHFDRNKPLIIATKGLDFESGNLLTESIENLLPGQMVAMLGGPNLAFEIANNLPASINISCTDLNIAKIIAEAIETDTLAASLCTDIVTPQVAGAIKNIVSVVAGIFDALNFGHNAKAFLLSQGLKEIKDLSLMLGGTIASCFNVAAIGDLSLGINARKSRNYNFGYDLISSDSPQQLIENYPHLVEGIYAARALEKLLSRYQIELPLCQTVIDMLKNPVNVRDTAKDFRKLTHT